jgi:glucose-6-phosphate isomerase
MTNNVIYENSNIFILNEDKLNHLKNLALSNPQKRSRICLHSNHEASVQEMIIVAHISTQIGAHKHPYNKAESYHMIEGELLINIYNELGLFQEQIILYSDSFPRMYRIDGNIWHEPIPKTDWVIYHEVYQGPFNKSCDVTYL